MSHVTLKNPLSQPPQVKEPSDPPEASTTKRPSTPPAATNPSASGDSFETGSLSPAKLLGSIGNNFLAALEEADPELLAAFKEAMAERQLRGPHTKPGPTSLREQSRLQEFVGPIVRPETGGSEAP